MVETDRAPQPCEVCGNPVLRRTARFCSRACFGVSQRGKPGAKKETPERACGICGTQMVRRRGESVPHFMNRQSCSEECRVALVRRKNHWLTDPHAVGERTLLARTCSGCGEIRPGKSFAKRATLCLTCAGRKSRDRRSEEQRLRDIERQHRKNVSNADAAVHYGDQWTGPELEMALRDDMSVTELAQALGRTYCAVVGARRKARKDPKWIQVVGVDEA